MKITIRWHLRKQAGSALLSMVVAFGILGVVIMVSTQSFKNNTDVIKKIKRKGELEDLRNYLRATVSCERTFENQLCPNPNESGCDEQVSFEGENAEICYKRIALKRRTDTDSNIVAKHSQFEERKKIGKYFLKASCAIRDGTRDIRVSYRTSDEADWQLLFTGIPFTCSR